MLALSVAFVAVNMSVYAPTGVPASRVDITFDMPGLPPHAASGHTTTTHKYSCGFFSRDHAGFGRNSAKSHMSGNTTYQALAVAPALSGLKRNRKRTCNMVFSIHRRGYSVSMSAFSGGELAKARRICVFCGSSVGANPAYLAEAKLLGKEIARRGWGLMYGGTSIGLMGATANSALSGGAEVIGVLPQALQDREIAHWGLTKLHLVESMHERKALMASLSDAFIALPGGYGTLDEFFEVVTWAQLNIHSKPCVLINSDGFYDFLLRFLDHAVKEQFVRPDNLRLVHVARDSAEALHWIKEQSDDASRNRNAGRLKP